MNDFDLFCDSWGEQTHKSIVKGTIKDRSENSDLNMMFLNIFLLRSLLITEYASTK